MEKETFYDRLGLSRDATPDEIRHAFREMAQRLHPDKNVRPGETELFIGVQEAYEVLNDPVQKQHYDSSLPPETQTQSPLSISGIYSRNSLFRLAEPQLFYALIELKALPAVDSLHNPPLNISLVLDCSTSMNGFRLDAVKQTAIELVRQLQPSDILSIVKFSDKAEVVVPAGNIDHRGEVETRIQLLHASGGTEIYQGLEASYVEVLRYSNKRSVNHIILITDGRTYGDEEDCLSLVDMASLHGIGISALGIGGQWNDAFLDTLTSRTGGNSKFVSKTDDLRHFLLDKVAKLGRSYAEQVAYHFELSPGVELKYAFRLSPEASPLPTTSPLIFGSLPRESDQSILLEFLLNEIPEDISRLTLIKGYISYEIPGRVERQMFSDRLEIWRPINSHFDDDQPPLSIVRALSRLTLYRMQERARANLRAGNIKDATRQLQSLATRLFAQGDNELARSVIKEVDHIQQARVFSEEGEKRIKYGTRSLLLPSGSEEKR
jgi:Ca-activated chloride channel family protein